MGKSDIKKQVVRPVFARAIRAIAKGPDEAVHNFLPKFEHDDAEQTLSNITVIVDDTGIRGHGINNVVKDPGSDTGYRITGMTGDSVVNYMIGPVKRAFEMYPRVHTYIMNMDKGPFVARPKVYTQKGRTNKLLDELETKQIEQLKLNADGSVPVIVARDKVLPAWLSVTANRVFYRVAMDETFDLIVQQYKPPRGCRLIIDALDRCASSPQTVEDWMCSERLLVDEFARDKIERMRVVFRSMATVGEDWRTLAYRVVKELAQYGHFKSVPICLETDADGVTSAPFLLPGAANQCGEADVGIMFWIDALQASKQHVTLRAERRAGVEIDPALAQYYGEDELARHNELVSVIAPNPISVAERREQAAAVLRDNPDAADYANAATRTALLELLALNHENPCRAPNRVMVTSCDTDFLSLLVLAYARICQQNPTDKQYALDNAPLLSIGECKVRRTGWLSSNDDFVYPVPGSSKKRKRDDDDDDDEEEAVGTGEPAAIIAHELYDIHRLYVLLLEKCGCATDSPASQYECALSYALFCASCENDYLAGLYFVNRKYMWEAFCALKGQLVYYNDTVDAGLLVPSQYQSYLKHAYWHSLTGARGNKNKPTKSAAQMTYHQMAAIVAGKYTAASAAQKHMFDEERAVLVFKRLQWWLVYASQAWISITRLLEDSVWGWSAGTVNDFV